MLFLLIVCSSSECTTLQLLRCSFIIYNIVHLKCFRSLGPLVTHSFHDNCYYLIHLFLEFLWFLTFRHISNGDTAELLINNVIHKETLERAEELIQYFKGHKFVLLKVHNFVDTELGIVFLNPIQFEQRRGE